MNTSYDSDSFAGSYVNFYDAIFRHCYFRVFDRERAKELAQETFVRTWQYMSKGKEVKNIKAFLYKVANNLIIDESRKKKSLSLDELKESGFDPGFDERERMRNLIDAQAARVMIEKLGEKYQDVVAMRYFDDFSPKEIARKIGETENVVSVRIHRGLKQLQKMFAGGTL